MALLDEFYRNRNPDPDLENEDEVVPGTQVQTPTSPAPVPGPVPGQDAAIAAGDVIPEPVPETSAKTVEAVLGQQEPGAWKAYQKRIAKAKAEGESQQFAGNILGIGQRIGAGFVGANADTGYADSLVRRGQEAVPEEEKRIKFETEAKEKDPSTEESKSLARSVEQLLDLPAGSLERKVSAARLKEMYPALVQSLKTKEEVTKERNKAAKEKEDLEQRRQALISRLQGMPDTYDPKTGNYRTKAGTVNIGTIDQIQNLPEKALEDVLKAVSGQERGAVQINVADVARQGQISTAAVNNLSRPVIERIEKNVENQRSIQDQDQKLDAAEASLKKFYDLPFGQQLWQKFFDGPEVSQLKQALAVAQNIAQKLRESGVLNVGEVPFLDKILRAGDPERAVELVRQGEVTQAQLQGLRGELQKRYARLNANIEEDQNILDELYNQAGPEARRYHPSSRIAPSPKTQTKRIRYDANGNRIQ